MRTSITLSKNSLIQNITSIRKLLGPTKKIISVVKANAYGHGMKEVVSIIESFTDAYAIDDIQELVDLRKRTTKEIYILGHVCEGEVDGILEHNGIPVVYEGSMVEMLEKAATIKKKTVDINIKIDTFLGRQGILIEQLPSLLKKITACKWIRLRGIYSHFSNIEDTRDFTHAQRQIDVFKEACVYVEEQGYVNIEKHMSSTAGIMAYDHMDSLCTHVRLGLGLYGLWPSEDLKKTYLSQVSLAPVLSWKSCIAQVKTVPANFPIGYGCTYVTEKSTTIAIVPQGYSDGYDRSLSNKGEMLVRGKRCPVIGRVAMNMCVIDVSGVEGVKLEDEVVLIGSQGGETVSADHIAALTDTISYEVVARISPLLPRRIV